MPTGGPNLTRPSLHLRLRTDHGVEYGDGTPHARGWGCVLVAGLFALGYCILRYGNREVDTIFMGGLVGLIALRLGINSLRTTELRIDRTAQAVELRRRFAWGRATVELFTATTAVHARLARAADGDWHLTIERPNGELVLIDRATDVEALRPLAADLAEALGVPGS